MRTMKNCPMCSKGMAIKYPIPPDNITRMICSTHVDGSKLSHYYVEMGKNQVEIIHVPPYTIINNSDHPDKSYIYPLDVNSPKRITDQSVVCVTPRIKISDPSKLADRVKLFVLFS